MTTGLNAHPDAYRLAISRALIKKENANTRTKKVSRRERRRQAFAAVMEKEMVNGMIPQHFKIENGTVSRTDDGAYFMSVEGRNEPVEISESYATSLYEESVAQFIETHLK